MAEDRNPCHTTAGDDGTARTWAADGTPRATLAGHHDGWVTA